MQLVSSVFRPRHRVPARLPLGTPVATMEAMPASIVTNGLTKSYDGPIALDHLDLEVERGEIFGFLGPNGAGKSTAIRLLLDLIRPTAGNASIHGHDCQSESETVRSLVGYLPGDLRLYPGMTVQGTIDYIAGMRRRPVNPSFVATLADRLSLDTSRRVGGLSKGNRQKIGVVLALIDEPPVLLLDEPTSGLDPLLQHGVWNLLRDEAEKGCTVFFSSHVMSEVDTVCERVGILRGGKLVAVEPVSALKERAVRSVSVTFAGEPPPSGVIDSAGITEVGREGAEVRFAVSGDMDPLIKALAHHKVHDLKSEEPSLDEIMVGFYQQELAG